MFRIFARISTPISTPQTLPASTDVKPGRKPQMRGCHSERILSTRLEYTKMISPSRLELLNEVGIVTCGDLLTHNLDELTDSTRDLKIKRTTKRYRAAVRLALKLDGLRPQDASLLISIHRRSLHTLAHENAAQLHRDIARFAQSTRGRKQTRGRSLPSIRRVKRWIHTSRRQLGMAERSVSHDLAKEPSKPALSLLTSA